MANIRVYELARDLNMKNKALLDKLKDMEVPVRSHMSSLDEDTVLKIKSNLRGKSPEAVRTTRVKPRVIRRRRRTAAEEAAAGTEAMKAEALEPDAEDAPVDAEPVRAAAPTEAPPVEGPGEPVPAEEEEKSPQPAKKAAKKAKKKTKGPERSPARVISRPVAAAPEEVEATAGETETAAPETEAEAVEAASPPAAETTRETAAETSTAAEDRRETAPETPETAEGAAAEEKEPIVPPEEKPAPQLEPETPAEETAPPEAKTEAPTEAKPEKPAKSKKKKKGKRGETPAKIIKPPEEAPEAFKREIAAAATEEPAPETGEPAATETAGSQVIPLKDRKKKDKKGGEEAKKPKENRWAKKKISFKRKEVVEGADLYAGGGRGRKGKKGKTKQAPAQKTQITTPKAIKRRIKIDDTIALSDLAKRMGIKANEIIMKLMSQGMMVTVNQTVDFETAALVAAEFGYEVERAAFEEETFLKTGTDDDPEKMAWRPPVVTIMGHVDHGKTSLLDVIRKTRVTEGEAGGITQHIGAYYVESESGEIVFLDTPGHEAFTAMRARGATVTDLVVLVVAADDGVMPQTIEAINHSKAAGVPLIVAVNKIDKNNADPDRVMRELAEQGLVPEAWGGDTIFVKVSATQETGIDDLMEMILLQSEVLELKANPDKHAVGYVVEAKLDAGRGPVATVLIQDGTLHAGDSVVCGVHHGKIRAMLNDLGQPVNLAGPAIPVEILGLSGVPNAGDELAVLEDDKSAKQVSDHRLQKQRSVELAKTSRLSLDKLFERMQEGEVKDLNIILKADVHGSIEALKDSLTKLSNEEVAINVIHAATGTVTESDVSLAAVSDAIIIGFNIRPTAKVQTLAQEEHVDMRFYNVIYNAIKDVQDAIVGMMDSTFEERILGRVEVREVFHVPKVGAVAGCYVTDGKIQRQSRIRVLRDGVVIYEGKIASLRRFKDDVKEVATGYECGIAIEKFNDVKVGDEFECFYMEEIKPEL
jgi:translation initiation factor IF-2